MRRIVYQSSSRAFDDDDDLLEARLCRRRGLVIDLTESLSARNP